MGHPRPLFHLFSSFKQTLQFLQQINMKKCPSSIWCQDQNPRPLEYESPPIITRPGLPPLKKIFYSFNIFCDRYSKTSWPQMTESLSTYPENTPLLYQVKSLCVQLTPCFTGLDSTEQVNLLIISTYQCRLIKTGKTGGQFNTETFNLIK